MSPDALPRLLLLTDRTLAPDLPAVVAAAVQGGARAVVLRERDLPAPERLALGEVLARLLAPVSGTLLWAGPAPAADVPCHLAARDAPVPGLHGRSCHDVASLVAAAQEGCAWATLSPVHLTTSKPGHGPALGLDGLAALPAAARLASSAPAAPAAVPVYALGGIAPGRAAACRRAGAHGVAVMGAVMRAPDPAAVVADLLGELG